MLIKRFSSIKNIGRFVDCKQKGSALNHYNLFFAENGRGKTTLCAVLRSLKTGKSEHITERTTVPITSGPEVSIQLDTGTASYNEQEWSMAVPDIEIFDATFVAQNIHVGEYVNHDHRKNLFQVIIGEEGGRIAKEIKEIDEASRKKSSDIRIKKEEIQRHVPKDVNFEKFIDLSETPNIDDKIKEKESDLKVAQQAENIKAKPTIAQLPIPSLPTDLESALSENLGSISGDIKTKIEKQIESHKMHDHGQKWISEGLDYIHDDKCPFCGQNIKDIDLIKTYEQFFSDSYTKLIEKIDHLEEATEKSFGDVTLERLNTALSNNGKNILFWEQFATFEINDIDFESTVAMHAKLLQDAVLSLIQNKRKNPLVSISIDEAFQRAKEKYDGAARALDTYNNQIVMANAIINKQKEKASTANSAEIEREISTLKLKKLRYNSTLQPLCDEYLSLKLDKEKLDSDRNNAKDTLDNFADSAINNCEKTINDILGKFGAEFSITKSGKSYAGGKPSSVYQIQINKHSIPLGDDSTPPGEICFRTTLSAGDKSALALAFFLARLENDSKKAERIIVFDDPFNSQDRSRRECTADFLKKYGEQCAQLFLFCHDPHFLNLVYSKLPKNERHCLHLSRASNNTTIIEEWKIEKEVQSEYLKDLEDLKSYLDNNVGNNLDIARKIRPVVEERLRCKFLNKLPEDEGLGVMIGLIRDDTKKYPVESTYLEELEHINNFSKKYHHKTNPEPIDVAELRSYIQRTFSIIES